MIFTNLLYIYQLENYDKKRFLSFVYRHPKWHQLQERGEIQWTLRSRLLFALSLLLYFFSIGITFWKFPPYFALLPFLFGILFFPFFLVFADILLSPLVKYQKKKITKSATSFLAQQKKRGLLSVGITGSYGKTTMRDILFALLRQKYRVFTFPGNINTDIGIAQYILSYKEDILASDILLAEMGAYKKGEIADLCKIIQPDYSFTTAIGEAHLERFGSRENIAQAKFELAYATGKKSFLYAEDPGIAQYAKQFLKENSKNIFVSPSSLLSFLQEKDDFLGISFSYKNEVFSTKLIARYIPLFSVFAFSLAEELGLSLQEMKQGIAELDFVPHRLQVIRNDTLHRIIIDDSYNGNEAGFLEGLRILSRAKGRKIVLTPGIVELGNRSEEVHTSLAKEYAKNVDLVLLVENSNTKIIQRELQKRGFSEVKMYTTATQAHSDLPNILKNGDTILFQNDATDNYL